ncbi:MAG: hypothetical protein ACK4M3_07210 [Pyrobaculum sp.]
MLLVILAVVLAIFITAVEPFVTPLYATDFIKTGNFIITVGDKDYKYVELPWPLAVITATALIALSLYLEASRCLKPRGWGRCLKTTSRGLEIAIALVAILYASPLPYIFVTSRDVVIVVSNYAKYFSLPLFALALFIAISERLLATPNRARVFADLSATEEKTIKT